MRKNGLITYFFEKKGGGKEFSTLLIDPKNKIQTCLKKKPKKKKKKKKPKKHISFAFRICEKLKKKIKKFF